MSSATKTSGNTSEEKVPKIPSQQDKVEPVSGATGSGTKDEPFDQGNQEEMDVVSRKNEDHDAKEPASGQTGSAAYDKGNEGNEVTAIRNAVEMPARKDNKPNDMEEGERFWSRLS